MRFIRSFIIIFLCFSWSHVYAEYVDAETLWKNDDPNFLDSIYAHLNKKKLIGRTTLKSAAEQGKYNIAKALIEKGAAVNAKDGNYQTPLHYAAWRNQLKVAKLLLENGANVNARGGLMPLGFMRGAKNKNAHHYIKQQEKDT